MIDPGQALLQPVDEAPELSRRQVLDQLPVDRRARDQLVQSPKHPSQVLPRLKRPAVSVASRANEAQRLFGFYRVPEPQMRPYGAKGTDSVQAVKSCVDDSRRGRRPVSGVAGWVGRPEGAGAGVLFASWPCPPDGAGFRRARAIVNDLERSPQPAIVPGGEHR